MSSLGLAFSASFAGDRPMTSGRRSYARIKSFRCTRLSCKASSSESGYEQSVPIPADRLRPVIQLPVPNRRCLTHKVVVMGATSPVAQQLVLLLKLFRSIRVLNLYEETKEGASGMLESIASDLSGICTAPTVKAFSDDDDLQDCFWDADIVVIAAGSEEGADTTKDFENKGLAIRRYIDLIYRYSTQALIMIMTKPIESMVPMAAEYMVLRGQYGTCRLFGLTGYHSIQANALVASMKNLHGKGFFQHLRPPFFGMASLTDYFGDLSVTWPPRTNWACVDVPVVGGDVGDTIVPLLSKVYPAGSVEGIQFTEEEALLLRAQLQGENRQSVYAVAYAAARFIDTCLRALSGYIPESFERKAMMPLYDYAFVAVNPLGDSSEYFTCKIELGVAGIQHIYLSDLTTQSQEEMVAIAAAKEALKAPIQRGKDFAISHPM
ncbi:OLC1v1012878C1 [Oldenlandia corymbosa var. corymbosa]|nr:OLC1v1012878C1 [Oldenlandia corymbosa var. corymbosa]